MLWITLLLLFSFPALWAEIWNVSCPNFCTCDKRLSSRLKEEMNFVNCSFQNLTTIPIDIPSQVQILLLRGNYLITIPPRLSKMTNLEELDLSHNKIHILDSPLPFVNLSKLRYLNLDSNSLVSIYNGIFSPLHNLQHLTLAENRLANVLDNAFMGLVNLQKLNIANNMLTSISSDWFHGMHNLHSINLSYNHLKHIQSATFYGIPQLYQLYLSGNKLNKISAEALKGLDNLQYLYADNNLLKQVPSDALKILHSLTILILDKNLIPKIYINDFFNLPLHELSLSYMPNLLLVDYAAFVNLSKLSILQMHDNPKLIYIDPRAFVNATHLSNLYIHNNNIPSVQENLIKSLPDLTDISIYGNPIQCDCNNRWIKQIVQMNITRVVFHEYERITCDSPGMLKYKLFKNVRLNQIAKSCPPNLLPLFSDTFEKQVGESLELECRSLGIPKPNITWFFPNGKMVDNTSNSVRFKIKNEGTLYIRHLKSDDNGIYSCMSQNQNGEDKVTVAVSVRGSNIQIFPSGIAATFVTLVWNGTAKDRATNSQILYRLDLDTVQNYTVVAVGPFTRSYTINNLWPDTRYEFCIAFKDNDDVYIQMSCTVIATQDTTFIMQGIYRTSNVAVAIVMGIVGSMLIFICVGAVAARKYRQRHYENPDKNYVDQMSNIPLENLYSPLVTNINS